jgi:hypothetical protein
MPMQNELLETDRDHSPEEASACTYQELYCIYAREVQVDHVFSRLLPRIELQILD